MPAPVASGARFQKRTTSSDPMSTSLQDPSGTNSGDIGQYSSQGTSGANLGLSSDDDLSPDKKSAPADDEDDFFGEAVRDLQEHMAAGQALLKTSTSMDVDDADKPKPNSSLKRSIQEAEAKSTKPAPKQFLADRHLTPERERIFAQFPSDVKQYITSLAEDRDEQFRSYFRYIRNLAGFIATPADKEEFLELNQKNEEAAFTLLRQLLVNHSQAAFQNDSYVTHALRESLKQTMNYK